VEAASWALVGVTAVLVTLTAWYAYQTHLTVRRHEEEIEAMTRPVLSFQLIPWQPKLLKLRIQNVGNGPALDVEGEIRTVLHEDGEVSVPWAYPALTAGKYEEFGVPMSGEQVREAEHDLDKIRKLVREVDAQFSYRSASGESYKLKEAIAVAEVTNAWVTSRMMATQDHHERIMPRIAKALESIDDRLKRLSQDVDAARLRSLIAQQEEDGKGEQEK
jgi:hypothetical protein